VLIVATAFSTFLLKKMNSRQGPCWYGYCNGDHALHSATLSGEANREPGW
jgi:hypothetical protein